MKLHNYFKEYKTIAEKAIISDKVTRDLLLGPLVDSSELFYRTDKLEDRDKLVYIFMDGSDSIRSKKINEDWTCNMPIFYIGMGNVTRPLDHWESVKVNPDLRDLLECKHRNHQEVILMIYACSMTDEEAKELEADLICQVKRIQSPTKGLSVYRSKRSPIRLVNNKNETSNQRAYSTNGIRQKKQ